MGPQNWEHISFNNFQESSVLLQQRRHLWRMWKEFITFICSYYVAFTGSSQSSKTCFVNYSVYEWLKDIILKSLPPFAFPTEIQQASDSIMRRIWCSCKSEIPCSTRTCDYKRYGFVLWFSSNSCFSSHFFFSDFQLFRPEHHRRDLSSWNAHLVHQNCLRISFTFVLWTFSIVSMFWFLRNAEHV
jgi:hypothetical protein